MYVVRCASSTHVFANTQRACSRNAPRIPSPTVRIVKGRWAGRKLMSPAGPVRPTTEALRDIWMTMLEDRLQGADVLELFAGSGALGIEALSRGAHRCDFVENHPAALHALKANVAAFRLRDRTRIFKRDAIPFAQRLEPSRYDIALADPPYGSRKLDRVVSDWLELRYSRLLAVEHEPGKTFLVKGKSRQFGESAVTVLKAPGTK